MAQPIAGNQNFTKVENHAGQFGMLKTQEANVAGDAHIGGSIRANEVLGGLVVSVPAGKVLQKAELQTVAGALAANSNAACVLRSDITTNFTFPTDASTIVAVRLTVTTGYVGATTLQAGPNANATAAGANAGVLSATTQAALANVGDVVSVSSGAGDSLGGTGAPPGVAVSSGNFFLTGNTAAAGGTAFTAGAANVDVWYY